MWIQMDFFTPTHSTFADVVLKYLAKHENNMLWVSFINRDIFPWKPPKISGGCIPDAKLHLEVTRDGSDRLLNPGGDQLQRHGQL